MSLEDDETELTFVSPEELGLVLSHPKQSMTCSTLPSISIRDRLERFDYSPSSVPHSTQSRLHQLTNTLLDSTLLNIYATSSASLSSSGKEELTNDQSLLLNIHHLTHPEEEDVFLT
jgi:hypothetical protein